MKLNEIVDNAFIAIKNSSDFSDTESTAYFMLLIDTILSNPMDLVILPNKRKCAIVLSSIAVSDFCREFPTYNGRSTGEIICASGFYVYMNLLESGDMFDADFPAFILMLHYGRKYIGEIYGHFYVAKDKVLKTNEKFGMQMPYDPEKKKRIFAKGIELRMIRYCNNRGTSNSTMDEIRYALEGDNEIPHDYNDEYDPFDEAIRLYKQLRHIFSTPIGFEFLYKKDGLELID